LPNFPKLLFVFKSPKPEEAEMKITTNNIIAGFVLLLALVSILVWLAFGVFNIFRIGNIVSGNSN